MDETANKYNIPKFKSPITEPRAYGITAYPNNPNINVNIGPKKNSIKFAWVGLTYSFNNNFNASAKACRRP